MKALILAAGFGTRMGALKPVLLEPLHHQFHMFTRVHRAQAGKDVERVLTETNTVVLEVRRTPVVPVAPQDPVFLLDTYYALDPRQRQSRS